ncbi:MAG: sortase [Patescibacteria group bacterium]
MADQIPPQPTNQSNSSNGLTLQALRYSKTQPVFTPLSRETPIENSQAEEPAPVEKIGRPPEARWLIYVKTFGVFIFLFLFFLGILNGPAWYQRLSYQLSETSIATPQLGLLPKLQDAPIQLINLKDRPADYLDSTIQIPGYSLADLGDNQLLIPKIKVKAPIIWGSETDETSMLASLQQGVAHYGFSARPDEGRGNVFLTGHSSYFFWDKGQYKTIFANLDRLETGDQIALTYQGVVYLYQVREKKVVKPTDFEVTNATDTPTLSLMTCVPVGTNLNRLVVQADLISAAPSQPVPVTPQSLKKPAAIFSYLPF